MNNEEIELQHIKIELDHNRGQHLRHFVDQYFCYKNGYIKRTGTANWEGVVWNEHVSLDAQKTTDRKKVVKEHVIPLKRIKQDLLELPDKSIESIKKYLNNHVIFATITKEEDKRLRDKKLHSSMPEGYDLNGDDLFLDPFARYKVANIVVKKMP